MPVGAGFRRGAPTGMLKLRIDTDDEKVRQFFDRINSEVVSIIPAGSRMKVTRSTQKGYRMGPILRIAEDLALFDHLENPAVRPVLYPEFVVGFKIARRGDVVRHARNGTELTYTTDDEGNCRFTFRKSTRDAAARGGAAGRAKGAKDKDPHIEPTLYVEKYDPTTGAVIEDDDTPGRWRAFMVTFPLLETVRGVRVAEVAYPIPTSPYDNWMTPDERAARDAEIAQGAA